VLAVALWPAAAHARVAVGHAGNEQPRLWGVEIGTSARAFMRPTHLARMKHAGINAVVVDPRRLTLKDLRATVKAAKGARLWVIEVIPPAGAKATRSVKTVRATCRAPRQPAQTLCATSTGSLSAAIALSRSVSAGPMVAVRLAGPAQVARLRGVFLSGSPILALVKLRAHRFATSAWRKAIGIAATTSSLDLAVTPTGTSNQTLTPYLNQLGKPPAAPGSLAVTGSTASTISVAWAAVVGATEYNLTANGKFSGKTATTSFTFGGLACGTAYKLAVTAKNAAGKTSKASTLMASTASCSDTTPPAVSVTAPTADATVSGNVSVTASASDNVGLARVEFWVDGVPQATDTSAPYSYGWDTTQVAGGPHTILAKAFDTSNNSASKTVGVTVSNSPCVTSSTSWQNTAMLSPDGTFDVSFDATPSAGNVDAVTGLSAAPALAYTDLAVIARFNSNGSIDAINGGGYGAANTVPYAGGSTYHFRAAVNVSSHSYSLYVTPPGRPETPVALNYAFRTGQTDVTALSNWAVTAAAGSHQTCGLAVTNPTDMTAPSAPTGLAKTSSTQTSLSVSWTASTDNVGVAGYTVYVNGAASSAAAGTSRTISGLSCGSTYTIGVDAYDAAGNHSAQTSTTMSTSACPGDTTPPSTPTGLATSAVGQTSITLSWTASSDNVGVTGYRLYLGGSQVGTSLSTSYVFSGLTCGTSYTLGVAAVDAAGNVSGIATIAAATAACSPPPPGSCTTTISSGLAAAIQNASAGSTICVASGTYTGFTLTSISKSSDVTIQPVSGASVSIGSVNFQNVNHLHFSGASGSMTIQGSQIDPSDSRPNCSNHITIDYVRFTGGLNILPRCASMAILVDHDTFDNLGASTWEGRLNVQSLDVGPSQPNGVTISNSHFSGSGTGSNSNCSDGIDVLGGAYGTVIGPGNEFTNMPQNSCVAHVDPIQLYGASHTTITGNYFHDNGNGSGGIMMGWDSDFSTVSNNVFVCSCVYPWSIHAGSTHNSVFRHNTFAGGGRVRFEVVNGASPSGDLVRDNVFTSGGGISTDGSNYGSNDHNLNAGVSGTGNITGTPIFVGGSNPTTYAGYRLTSGSPGKGAASDGTDMGIN
jgi:chitodextrinase